MGQPAVTLHELQKFQTFLDLRVVPDLQRCLANQALIKGQISSYEHLQEDLETYGALRKPATVLMDVGSNVYAHVKLEDAGKLRVDIGAGIVVEFSIIEAIRFCHDKLYGLDFLLKSHVARELDLVTHIDMIVANLEALRGSLGSYEE